MSNGYTYQIPFTEDELYECYVNRGMTQKECGQYLGVSQKVIWLAMRKMGVPARKACKRDQRGSKNSSWVGGRILMAVGGKSRVSKSGYYYVKRPEHPNADRKGYVAEHIMVASERIGRPLRAREMVHHIDMDKHNNDPANLAVCDAATHANWHRQLEAIAIRFYRQGKLSFVEGIGYEVPDDLC